jgi:uncharacterized Zn-binding protein involved in type VI secretion
MPGAVRAQQDIFGKGGRVAAGECTVLVNGRPAARRGDIVLPHLAGGRHKIPSPIITGKCTVVAGSRPMANKSSFAACFDFALTASCDVQVG